MEIFVLAHGADSTGPSAPLDFEVSRPGVCSGHTVGTEKRNYERQVEAAAAREKRKETQEGTEDKARTSERLQAEEA
jgi:hypothetical protein